jgi:hypothetical protein
MKRLLCLVAALACACASAEMRSAENDPANPSATVAALDVGAGVLSSSFSPDSIAPAAAPDDPHAGHDMTDPHAGHHHAPPGDSAASDAHAAHDPPAPSGSTSAASRPLPAPKKPAVPTATSYTCMHHPEIVSAAKGQCPKCGMDLVPKKPAASGQQP